MAYGNFVLGREGNRITIAGEFGAQDVRRVFAAIHDAVNNRGHTDLVLDFSRCELAFSAAMLPICAHVLNLKKSRIDFSLKIPENDRLARLFVNTGWANFICPRDYGPPKIDGFSKQFPAVQYQNHNEQEALLNGILEKLLSVIPNFNRSAFAAVEWALNEISDNVLNHSQSPIGGLLQLSVFDTRRNKVEFTIADAGLGVPQTLRSSRKNISSDVDALMEAVKSGVTRNATDFQGNGLYGTLEICRSGGGKFSLNAGHGALICNRDGVNTKNENIPFAGTCVDSASGFF